jgi:hypothetical protein
VQPNTILWDKLAHCNDTTAQNDKTASNDMTAPILRMKVVEEKGVEDEEDEFTTTLESS